MFDNFPEFEREMKAYQLFRSRFKTFSKVTTDRSFRNVQIFCWFLGLLLNLFYLNYIIFSDFNVQIPVKYQRLMVLACTLVLLAISLITGVFWFITNYQIV